MFSVSLKRNKVLLTLFATSRSADRSYSLHCVRFRLALRHHDSLFVLVHHVTINGNDGARFVRYDFHLMAGDVHLCGQLVTLHGLDEDGIRLIVVVAGYEGPFVGYRELDHAVLRGDHDFRIDRADLCKGGAFEVARIVKKLSRERISELRTEMPLEDS